MKLMNVLSENEGFNQKKERMTKKAKAYYKFLRKGSFKHSQKHSQKNYDKMVEHTYNYTLSEFHNIVVPMGSNIPTLICDIIVKDTNDEVKPVSIWIIQGYLRRIFEKHDIEISIRDAYGDVEPRVSINEEVDPEYKKYLELVKKKAIKAYNHFRKGKVLWHDDVYTYEFSEGFEPGGYGLIKDKKRYFFLYPNQLIIKGHGLYKKEHPDYPNGYIVKQDHLPYEQIQKLIGILFEKYGVSIRIKDHSIIDRQERDQINEESDDDVKMKDKLHKKGETYYKFYKKGTFTQRYVNNDMTDIYSYELSDEHYVHTKNDKDIFINCGIHVEDTSGNKKLIRPHLIQSHLRHVFAKHNIEIYIQNFSGDINNVSPAKPMGYDEPPRNYRDLD